MLKHTHHTFNILLSSPPPPPQRETNCKIAIRGRGSVKEGISKDPKYDYGEDEELHVLITGETQSDVSDALSMTLGRARITAQHGAQHSSELHSTA